jgi:hypothetical protein
MRGNGRLRYGALAKRWLPRAAISHAAKRRQREGRFPGVEDHPHGAATVLMLQNEDDRLVQGVFHARMRD